MRPLFTVHAGEFLVGEYIEQTFSSLKVWIPAKDTGIDLLVTDASAHHAISLQVKLSRDYRPPEATEDLDRSLTAAGWLTLDHDKIEKSPAQRWVIVLVSHERKMKPQFIVIPPPSFYHALYKFTASRRSIISILGLQNPVFVYRAEGFVSQNAYSLPMVRFSLDLVTSALS